jgi:ActR/RegA family two-component response regulator
MVALQRLLIINDEPDFARLFSRTAERLGFATRTLRHTLDLEYVVQHWRPDFVAVQMEMPDRQDIEVLEFLEQGKFSGSVLLTGHFPTKALSKAAEVARLHGLNVVSIVATPAGMAEIEVALKQLVNLGRAA